MHNIFNSTAAALELAGRTQDLLGTFRGELGRLLGGTVHVLQGRPPKAY